MLPRTPGEPILVRSHSPTKTKAARNPWRPRCRSQRSQYVRLAARLHGQPPTLRCCENEVAHGPENVTAEGSRSRGVQQSSQRHLPLDRQTACFRRLYYPVFSNIWLCSQDRHEDRQFPMRKCRFSSVLQTLEAAQDRQDLSLKATATVYLFGIDEAP